MSIPAGVITDPAVVAVIAGFDMSAEGWGSAELDRRHDATLDATEMALMGKMINRTVAAEEHPPLRAQDASRSSGGRHNGAVPGTFALADLD